MKTSSRRSPITSLAVAAVVTALALLSGLSLDPLFAGRYPFITFFPAVMISAWFGGFWAGLMATAASAALVAQVWLQPVGSPPVSVADAVALVIYAVIGLLISGLTESLHRRTSSESQAVAAESLARNRVDQLVASIPGVVWEAWGAPDTAMQRIDFVSPYVESMVGDSVSEWLGTPNFWLTIVHPDDRERAATVAAAAYAEGRTHVNEFRWIRKDGRVIWCEAHATVIRDEQGRPAGMRGVTLDVSARKALEVSERQAIRDAEEANRVKDRFLATVSHELPTPLNVVMGWVDMLIAGRIEEARRPEALRIVMANARRQSELVEELLDVSRMASGTLQLRRSPIDAAPVLRAALDSARALGASAGVEMRIDCPLSLPLIDADPGRLQQVFTNLLSNALKFTPRGGTVVVSARADGDSLEFEVVDTGHGIAADFLPFVFEPFRQAGPPGLGGLGLGLSIVKQVVEGHGGTVGAASDGPGKGAIFKVRLPLLPAVAPA